MYLRISGVLLKHRYATSNQSSQVKKTDQTGKQTDQTCLEHTITDTESELTSSDYNTPRLTDTDQLATYSVDKIIRQFQQV